MRLRILPFVLAGLAVTAPTLTAQSIRVGASVEELEARARADSLDAAAHYNLALGYMSRRAWGLADTALVEATSLDPHFALAWLARAVARDRDDRFWDGLRRSGGDSARAEARRRASYSRRAFMIDPFVDLRVMGGVMRLGGDAYDGLAYFYGRDYSRFVAGYRSGLRALVEGNYDLAFSGFNQAMVIVNTYRDRGDSLPPDLLFLHVLAAAGSAHLSEAMTSASVLLAMTLDEEAVDTNRVVPLHTNEYRYILAALKQRSGALEEAARLYREVASTDIGNYMAHVQLARLHETATAWDSAIAERRAAVNADPENHALYLDLGTLLARTAHYEEAETALVEARDLNPRDPRVYYRLGVVQELLEQRSEARASYERFVAIAPSRFAPAIADARARIARLD